MTEYALVLGVMTPVIVLLFTGLLNPMAARIDAIVAWLT